jgi:hypothetical protein
VVISTLGGFSQDAEAHGSAPIGAEATSTLAGFSQSATGKVMWLWTPDQLDDLYGWWKADSLLGSLTNDDPVGTWDDSSSNDYAVTAVLTARPTFKSNILNGWPVVRFDGSNDSLTSGDFASEQSTPNTIFAVWSTAASGTMFCCDGTNNDKRHGIFQGTGELANVAAFSGTIRSYDRTVPFSALITGVQFGSSGKIWENGTEKVSADLGTHVLSGLRLGARQGGSLFLNGDIAEVVLCNNSLSATDRQKVEGYLAHKYGVQGNLPAGHPYKSAAPTTGSLLAIMLASNQYNGGTAL